MREWTRSGFSWDERERVASRDWAVGGQIVRRSASARVHAAATDVLCVLAAHGLVEYSAKFSRAYGGSRAQGILGGDIPSDQESGCTCGVCEGRRACGSGGGWPVHRPRCPAKTYEASISQRVVVIEFDSLAKALACHDTPAYQAALKVLGDGADRDIRIAEGVA